jgi:pimeloyl-ACP methyl ester carboxylesterase
MQMSPTRRVSTAFKNAARLFTGVAVLMAAAPSQAQTSQKPTIILVHGAFADSSSWQGVIRLLQADGYPVIAQANPLRGVKSDSSYLANLIDSIKGPVVLVGHSFSGMLISNAATGKNNVKALVFVAALAPDNGETADDLLKKYPGGTSGSALGPPGPVSLGDKAHDLYVQPEKFHAQFAADVPAATARIMAVTQRPIVDTAFGEPSGTPAWRSIPSWFIHGTGDKNLPVATVAFMAKRAGAKKVVEIKGASHLVMVSHPKETEKLIVAAAQQTAGTQQPAAAQQPAAQPPESGTGSSGQ